MRLLSSLILILFLTGCTSQIRIEDYKINESYNQTNKNMTYSIQFTLYNPSLFQKADCKAEVSLNEQNKEYVLGEVEPKSKYKYIIPFEMPNGESNISLTQNCSFK